MADATANLAIKDRFTAAVFSGDRDVMQGLLAPDFELHQPSGLAYSGVYTGADGFLVFLGKFMLVYEIKQLENTRTFIGQDPDDIVLEFVFRGTFKPTGQPFNTTLLEHWRYREGKIVLIKPYWFEMPTLG